MTTPRPRKDSTGAVLRHLTAETRMWSQVWESLPRSTYADFVAAARAHLGDGSLTGWTIDRADWPAVYLYVCEQDGILPEDRSRAAYQDLVSAAAHRRWPLEHPAGAFVYVDVFAQCLTEAAETADRYEADILTEAARLLVASFEVDSDRGRGLFGPQGADTVRLYYAVRAVKLLDDLDARRERMAQF